MKTLRFTTHALERAVQRFFPGETLDAAEKKLMAGWNASPAKLKEGGMNEERWLLNDPAVILVCAIEVGERVVKTILRPGRTSSGEFELEADTLPAPSPRGKLIIRLEVDYLINDVETSHAEVQTNLESIALKGFKGSMNSKKMTVMDVKASSESAIGSVSIRKEP